MRHFTINSTWDFFTKRRYYCGVAVMPPARSEDGRYSLSGGWGGAMLPTTTRAKLPAPL